MPWGRLDDTLYDHPKLDMLGKDRLSGIGLWLLCISWSNRHLTDGLIPRERVVRLGGTVRLADALVTAGLFDSTTDGYFVHDFLSFNRSRTEVENERRSSRERMAEHRANNGRSSTPVQVSRLLPSVPIHSSPSDPRRIVDEREMTDAERDARLQERLAKRTGVS